MRGMTLSNGNSFSNGHSMSIFGTLEPWWFRLMRPVERGQTWG